MGENALIRNVRHGLLHRDMAARKAVCAAALEWIRHDFDDSVMDFVEQETRKIGYERSTWTWGLFMMASENCITPPPLDPRFVCELKPLAISMAQNEGKWSEFETSCVRAFLEMFGQHDSEADAEEPYVEPGPLMFLRHVKPRPASGKFGFADINTDKMEENRIKYTNQSIHLFNFVATFEFGSTIMVRELVHCHSGIYNMALQGLRCKMAFPSATSLEFCSGVTIVVGAQHIQAALVVAWQSTLMMRERGYDTVTVTRFKPSNVTATFVLRGAFDVVKYWKQYQDLKDTQFNFSMFPGISIFWKQPKCTVTMFWQGRGCIAGCGSVSKVWIASQIIMPKLEEYLATSPAAVQQVHTDATSQHVGMTATELRKARKKAKMAVAAETDEIVIEDVEAAMLAEVMSESESESESDSD